MMPTFQEKAKAIADECRRRGYVPEMGVDPWEKAIADALEVEREQAIAECAAIMERRADGHTETIEHLALNKADYSHILRVTAARREADKGAREIRFLTKKKDTP